MNELIEGQIEGSTSISCQQENDLTPKGKAKVTVSHLKPRKHEQISYPEFERVTRSIDSPI